MTVYIVNIAEYKGTVVDLPASPLAFDVSACEVFQNRNCLGALGSARTAAAESRPLMQVQCRLCGAKPAGAKLRLGEDHPIKPALFMQSRKDCVSHDLCARDYPAPIGMLQG